MREPVGGDVTVTTRLAGSDASNCAEDRVGTQARLQITNKKAAAQARCTMFTIRFPFTDVNVMERGLGRTSSSLRIPSPLGTPSVDCWTSLCSFCGVAMVRMDCLVDQLAQQPLEACQHPGGGMCAPEIFAAARGSALPVFF